MRTLTTASVLVLLCLGFNEPTRTAHATPRHLRTNSGHRPGVVKSVATFARFCANKTRWLLRGLKPATVTRFKAGDPDAKAKVRETLQLSINRQHTHLSNQARAEVRQVPAFQMQQLLARLDALIDSGARVTIKEKTGWPRPRVGGNARKPEQQGLSPNKRVTIIVKRPFGFSKTASAKISRHENSMVVNATFKNFDRLTRANPRVAEGTLPGTSMWPGGLSAGSGADGKAIPSVETIRIKRAIPADLTEVTHRLGNGRSKRTLVDTQTGKTTIIAPPARSRRKPSKSRIRDNLRIF